jgi:hypothetical protein
VSGQGGTLPRIVKDDVAERVVLEVEAPTAGGKPLRLSIVIVGKAAE